jgi:sugar-specific transcriptional regulator TrmB
LSDREWIRILTELGLTSSQATLYLTLTRYIDTTARDLHKATDIARQDVYQILFELEELGLVERILTRPLRFKATSTRNAFTILSRLQESKNSELRKKALTLFERPEKREEQEPIPYEPFFELRNLYLDDPRVEAAICNAKVKIRLLDKNMHWPVFHSFIDEWTHALEKGIKVEVLNEFDTSRQIKPKFMDDLRGTDFQIKYAKILPAGACLIFDNKEVATWESIEPKQHGESAPPKALWSNHHGLIEIATNYFDLFWKNAAP